MLRRHAEGLLATAVGVALTLFLLGCAGPPSSAPSATKPAVMSGSDQERCQTSGGVWRNDACLTMGGGGY